MCSSDLENVQAPLGQVLIGSVDVKSQHRHGRTIGRALSARASLCRSLERACDRLWIVFFKNAALEIERVTLARDALRPFPCHGVLLPTGRQGSPEEVHVPVVCAAKPPAARRRRGSILETVCDRAFDDADGAFAAKPFGQRPFCRSSSLRPRSQSSCLCSLGRASICGKTARCDGTATSSGLP